MPYLIDGHNLIGQIPDIRLDDPNDEALLVQRLNGFAARTGKRCVVVFDSGLPGGKSRMSTGAVTVVFASPPTTADKILLERIRKTRDAGNWTVVSSDRSVLDSARKRGMRTMTSAAFAAELTPPSTTGEPLDKPPEARLSEDEIASWLKAFGDKK